MPAAEPRRRLFTIFIVTSKVLMGGFRLARVPRHPRFPDPLEPPGTPFRTLTSRPTWRSGKAGRGDLGMPPSVALPPLAKGGPHAMKKRSFRPRLCLFSDDCCTKNTQIEGPKSLLSRAVETSIYVC